MEIDSSRRFQPTLGPPFVDCPERFRQRFAATAWSAGMNDPAVNGVLDEVRVKWHQ
jgi:hypothetical protein